MWSLTSRHGTMAGGAVLATYGNGLIQNSGSGKVEPRGERWSDWLSADIAQGIMNRFPGYNSAFSYA